MAQVDDITEALCILLRKAGIEPELEHAIDSHRRVDVYGEVHRDGDVCDVPFGIEIKTSRQDFRTGYGRNFDFPISYICVPYSLVVYTLGLKYIRDIPSHVGVLAWVDGCLGLVELAMGNNDLDDWDMGCFLAIPDNQTPFANGALPWVKLDGLV